MSNIDSSFTSNNNYENNHVMISQGGNKKAMKKILSVALSTAMAFSMFASVAFGQSGLTDVNAQYNYLKDKGIFTGYTDGQAHLDRNMTRAEFATVIARTLGLEQVTGVVSFKDKNYSTKHWAAPYVEAVAKEGIMEGQNTTKKIFGLTSNVTVQEMATVLVRALKLEIPADSEINNTASAWAKGYVQAAINAGLVDANADFQSNATRALLVGAAYAMDQQVSVGVKSYNVTEAGKVVEFTMSDDQVVKVTLDQALEANKETEVKFTYNGKEYTHKVTYVVTATVVESVSALNNKEIKVTFNKEVDKNSAETVENYTLSNSSLGAVTPKLSDDKKSVILTVATAAAQQATTDVTVKNVKDVDGKTVEETKKSVTFLDTTLPTASQVEVTGPKTLKVTFSEPMQTAPTFKLNGGAYSVTPSLSADGKSATLTLGAVLPNGEHTLEVSGGSDFSSATGFAILKQELKFNYAADTTAPTATVEKATETKVTLKFNKPVSTANLNSDVTAYHSINNSANYKGTIVAVDAVNGYADTFEITFTTPIPTGTGKVLYLNTKENKFEDQWGNDVASTNFTFNIVSDTVAPTVTKVEATGKNAEAQKELTVTLSEEVVKEDAENRLNYILKDAQGNIVKTTDYAGVDSKGNLVGAKFSYDKTTNQVKITLGTVLNAGNYKLEVANIKDVSFAGNKMTAQSVDFTITDKIAPTVGNITHDATNNVIYVNFSEAMNSADLADASNYFLLDDSVSKELPTGSKVEVVSPQKVKITIPANSTYPASTSTVKVQVKGNVKDVAGNAIGGLFGQSTNSVTWGTASTFEITPAEDQVKLVAKNQLQFELPTELAAIDSSKFTITCTGNDSSLSVASATYVNNAGKSTVTVTLSGNITTTDLSTITKLDLAAGAVTNAEGLALTGTPSFVQASNHIQDKLAAEIVSVETTAANQITVTFSENIPTGEIANATFAVAGNTVTSVSHTGGQKTAVITLKDAIETDETPAVSQVLDIKDAEGNVLAAGTKVIDTVDKLAPIADSATENADAKVITLTFTEALDASTVIASNFTGTAGSPTLVEYTAGSKTVKLTYETALDNGKTIIVGAAVKDAKGNAITSTTFTRGAQEAGSGQYSK